MPTPSLTRFKRKCYTALLASGGLLLSQAAAAQHLAVRHLTCAYQAQPLGVQQATPTLSWEISSDQRNVTQTAYRILVSDTKKSLTQHLGNTWDSGKITSGASLQISYAGRPLLAAKTYYWQVQVFDNQGKASEWSDPGAVADGPAGPGRLEKRPLDCLRPAARRAGSPLSIDGSKDPQAVNNVLPLLRKSFTAKKTVQKATLFISGLGQFEALLNGQKVGNHFLDPGWTKYDQLAEYVTFDVTSMVKSGPNALGVMLGNGFYYVPPNKERYIKLRTSFGYPKLICRLALDYADGSREDVVSDPSWRTTAGPITFSSIYGGEDYNAALEPTGWATAAFRAQAWRPVITVDGPPQLVAQQQEPLRVVDTFKAQSISGPQPGKWVYDFGQNASGIIELQVRGRRGDTVRIAPGELLRADKTVSQQTSGEGYYFTYVLKGNGLETWRPRFSYYGFRYAQVSGGVPTGQPNPTGRPEIVRLTALHTRNAAARAGTFSCSSDLFNRTNTLIDWAIQSNMASVFTDCPHREKLGWLEENAPHGRLAALRLRHCLAGPQGAGRHPRLADREWAGAGHRARVHAVWGRRRHVPPTPPEWGSASIILPWYLYQWYGDRQALTENYSPDAALRGLPRHPGQGPHSHAGAGRLVRPGPQGAGRVAAHAHGRHRHGHLLLRPHHSDQNSPPAGPRRRSSGLLNSWARK